MSKFRILQSNQRFMSLLLHVDVAKGDNRRTKLSNGFFASMRVLLILFISFASLLMCAVRVSMQSYDFTTRLTAALLFVALAQATTMFVNIGVNIQKITNLYQTLQSIVDNEGNLEIFSKFGQEFRLEPYIWSFKCSTKTKRPNTLNKWNECSAPV